MSEEALATDLKLASVAEDLINHVSEVTAERRSGRDDVTVIIVLFQSNWVEHMKVVKNRKNSQ